MERQGEQKEVEAMRKRMRVEENEVRLGDRDAVSEELQHAKKIGFENAVRFSAEAREVRSGEDRSADTSPSLVANTVARHRLRRSPGSSESGPPSPVSVTSRWWL